MRESEPHHHAPPRRLARAFTTLAVAGAAFSLPPLGDRVSPDVAGAAASSAPTPRLVRVTTSSAASLSALLRQISATVVRRIPALGVAELRLPSGDPATVRTLERLPGIESVERPVVRRTLRVEPALVPAPQPGGSYEWQFAATRSSLVPAWVRRAAAKVTIAVIDSGADLTAPDLATKTPSGYNALDRTYDVHDTSGHGTFVASVAAGSVTNGEGLAGFGGDARLLVIKASADGESFNDFDEASAIVYAVERGAKVINLGVGGPETSETERLALDYAASHDVLVVAAAGNEYDSGAPVQYPAALLQPVGSNGKGGTGLAVGASNRAGGRASFSETGTQISLVAPGENVFGALAGSSPTNEYLPVALRGSRAGRYGFGSGTSFAAPQVAGAAALVFATNPALTSLQVAEILKLTASGHANWSPDLGYGVLDVGAAVANASGKPLRPPKVNLRARRRGNRAALSWSTTPEASSYTVLVREPGAGVRTLSAGARTALSVPLVPGRRYSFSVVAADELGATLARSRRVKTALPPGHVKPPR